MNVRIVAGTDRVETLLSGTIPEKVGTISLAVAHFHLALVSVHESTWSRQPWSLAKEGATARWRQRPCSRAWESRSWDRCVSGHRGMELTANKSKTSAAKTRSGAGQQNSWHREDYRTECENVKSSTSKRWFGKPLGRRPDVETRCMMAPPVEL